jgi:monoamine oxidase
LFTVLEARARIGGRICTERVAGLPHPIELGAEFVHGTAPETIKVAASAGLMLCDVRGERWQSVNGRLVPFRDFWKRLDSVMRRLDPDCSPDRSFMDFLATKPGGKTLARERALAMEFVQGFHAADPARISERSLAAGGSPGEDPNEQRMARVLDGYDRVPQRLAATVGEHIALETVVTRIAWRRGDVRLTSMRQDGSVDSVRARAAIVTVPLGVLLAPSGELGSIAFEPAIDRVLAHARGLAMGSVLRITLRLHERFWEDLPIRLPRGTSLNALSFLHTRDEDVPVWWTTHPIRAPLIVGWAGGPRATRLLNCSVSEIERRAVLSLARQLAVDVRTIRRVVEHVWTHDWDHDPFTRGAYSYGLVGGIDAPRHLARPVEQTLYFAGEAADPEGRLGTVNGAIATGVRAAKACVRALSGAKSTR